MKYINLELSPLLLYATYDRKHSFYEDVLPSERIETCDAMWIHLDYYLHEDNIDYEDNIDKDNKPLKLTLTKNNNKKLKR